VNMIGPGRFQLDFESVKRVARNTLIAAASAGVAYAATQVPHMELGVYAVFLVPPVLAGLDLARKFLESYKDEAK